MAVEDAGFAQMAQVGRLVDVEQIVEDTAGQIAQIGGALAQIFVVHIFKDSDIFFSGGVKGELGINLLFADDFDDFLDEHRVFDHQQMRVKNIRLGRTHGFGHAPLDFGDLLAGLDERMLVALDFRLHLTIGELVPSDNVAAVAENKNFSAANSRRNGDATIYFFAFHQTRHRLI